MRRLLLLIRCSTSDTYPISRCSNPFELVPVSLEAETDQNLLDRQQGQPIGYLRPWPDSATEPTSATPSREWECKGEELERLARALISPAHHRDRKGVQCNLAVVRLHIVRRPVASGFIHGLSTGVLRVWELDIDGVVPLVYQQ